MRRRPPLLREIAFVLVAKMLALALLYVAFFSPSHRPSANADRTAQVLFGDAYSMRDK